MKKTLPHDQHNDPLDDLIAAALHGELTPEERTQFEIRLQNEPAARAAYHEAQLMHDLLEKTYRNSQPDESFEQRMISGVHRKIQYEEQHRETAWESLLALWTAMREFFGKELVWKGAAICGVVAILVSVSVPSVTSGLRPSKENMLRMQAREKELAVEEQQERTDALKVPLVKNSPTDTTITETATSTYVQTPAPSSADSGVDFNTRRLTSPAIAAVPTVDIPAAPDSPSYIHQPSPAKKPEGLPGRMMAVDTFKAPTDAEPVLYKAMHELKSKSEAPSAKPVETISVDSNRKLIRNAELELEVKSFQAAMDQIAALTKLAGGYVDTSSSQRGGNGKLQGTVVVKVLPENLDNFLLKLRDLGQLKNQTLKTDDVTKAYFDTQARLENSRRMETQLQELLKRDNGKVSDLLEVERELGRVRGEIEQMQGELKLYDFQVQYATVTMQVSEKDLNQAAAYLLKEQDDFSLFATDVEGTFQQAQHVATDAKAQILVATLNHNSGSDVSAQLVVSVPPDQIESFLTQVKVLGRVSNFTRDTKRVAKDGGDSDQPADQTLTDKDNVMVNISVHSDDESPLQHTDLSVLSGDVDGKAQQIKKDAANLGVLVKGSNFERQTDGMEVAQMTFRMPMSKYPAWMENLKKLGKVESLTVSRQDQPDRMASDDTAPVEISLRLHSQGDLVSDDNGLWATLRHMFGEGASALLGSVRTIGVMAAFLAPWIFTLVLLAWVGRRIYVWKRK